MGDESMRDGVAGEGLASPWRLVVGPVGAGVEDGGRLWLAVTGSGAAVTGARRVLLVEVDATWRMYWGRTLGEAPESEY